MGSCTHSNLGHTTSHHPRHHEHEGVPGAVPGVRLLRRDRDGQDAGHVLPHRQAEVQDRGLHLLRGRQAAGHQDWGSRGRGEGEESSPERHGEHPPLPDPRLPLHVHQPSLCHCPPLLQTVCGSPHPAHHCLPPRHPPAQQSALLLRQRRCHHLHGVQDHRHVYVNKYFYFIIEPIFQY